MRKKSRWRLALTSKATRKKRETILKLTSWQLVTSHWRPWILVILKKEIRVSAEGNGSRQQLVMETLVVGTDKISRVNGSKNCFFALLNWNGRLARSAFSDCVWADGKMNFSAGAVKNVCTVISFYSSYLLGRELIWLLNFSSTNSSNTILVYFHFSIL